MPFDLQGKKELQAITTVMQFEVQLTGFDREKSAIVEAHVLPGSESSWNSVASERISSVGSSWRTNHTILPLQLREPGCGSDPNRLHWPMRRLRGRIVIPENLFDEGASLGLKHSVMLKVALANIFADVSD